MGSNLKTLQNEEIGMSLRSKKAILAKTNIVPGDFISFENFDRLFNIFFVCHTC